jgi:NADH-quinone oxidoreductase subunit A
VFYILEAYLCGLFLFKTTYNMQSDQLSYIPILMQLLLAVGFVVATIIVSGKLGPKRNSEIKDKNFECGIESVGNARIPFSVKYFLVAILFVLFDIEVIFLYPWAVNFKELGIEGMIKMVIFMLTLLVGFFYIIKKKALEWE